MAKKQLKPSFKTINWRYAFGEIAIVSIGIMLAFQLNSWRERNANKQLEKSSMMVLLSEVKKDSAIFNQYYMQANHHKQDALAILQILNSAEPNGYYDSLANCFRRCGTYSGSVLHRSAFQMMTAQGTLNLIKSDTLKNAIYSYYDRTHKVVEIWGSFEKQIVDEVVPKMYKSGVIDDEKVLLTNGLRIFYKQKMFVDELLKDENKGRIAVYMRSQNDMINVTNLNRRINKKLLDDLKKYLAKL